MCEGGVDREHVLGPATGAWRGALPRKRRRVDFARFNSSNSGGSTLDYSAWSRDWEPFGEASDPVHGLTCVMSERVRGQKLRTSLAIMYANKSQKNAQTIFMSAVNCAAVVPATLRSALHVRTNGRGTARICSWRGQRSPAHVGPKFLAPRPCAAGSAPTPHQVPILLLLKLSFVSLHSLVRNEHIARIRRTHMAPNAAPTALLSTLRRW